MRQEAIEKYGDWKVLPEYELEEWYLNGPGTGSEEAFEKALAKWKR